MSKIFCAAPWRGLHIQVDGGISTCCAGRIKFGNVNSDSIESALSHPKLKEIRKSIIAGDLPSEYCEGCKNAIKKNLGCERDWHNSCSKDFDITNADLEYQYPVIFDARWNNTCNSTCVYCSPTFSSKWASLLEIGTKKIESAIKNKITKFFTNNSSNLKSVAMVGGEPLLIKENENLLEIIPKDVPIDIITNFSIDIEKSRVFEKLCERRKVNWHISLENIKGKYEYVRQGSNWNQLEKNLKVLGKLIRNPPEKNDHEISFLSLYHILNCLDLCSLHEFSKEAITWFPYKLKNQNNKNIEVVWQDFYRPYELNVDNFGVNVVDLAKEEIERYLRLDINENQRVFFQNKYKSFENVKQDTSMPLKKQFSNFIGNKENLFKNKNSFINLWPQLKFLIV